MKYHALRYAQATMKEATLLTITVSHVNHMDLFIDSHGTAVDVERKKKLKEDRVEELFKRNQKYMLRHFGCTTYDELVDKMKQ